MSDVTFETVNQSQEPQEIIIGNPNAKEQEEPKEEVTEEVVSEETQPEVTEAPVVEQQSADNESNTDDGIDADAYVKETTGGRFETLDSLLESLNEQPTAYEFKDDYIKKAVEYYEKNGNLLPFLEATKADYDGMAPEDLVRHNLRKEYSELSDSAFDKLYKQEVINKYKLDEDEFTDDEIELGKQLLQRDANRIKQTLLKEREEFLQPQQEVVQEEQTNFQEEWSNTVLQDSYTNNLLNEKSISIDVDGEAFNYEVDDPQSMIDMTVDNSKFFNLFLDKSGQVDLNKWYKVVAFAMEPDTYDKSLVNHGKTYGVTQVEQELKNPDTPKAPAAMDSNQDWREAFLSAAINQKRT